MGKATEVLSRGERKGEKVLQYQSAPKTSKAFGHNSISLMKWLMAILGVLTMMTTAGCASGNNSKYRVPGSPRTNDFGINFNIDYKVFDSGTWSYNCPGRAFLCQHNHMGGRCCYQLFDILTLDFKFKDGRVYHEEIDLRPLIAEMIKTNTIPDLRKTKWGGRVEVELSVTADKLSVVYEVAEYIKKKENPPMWHTKYYRFPLFEKTLN